MNHFLPLVVPFLRAPSFLEVEQDWIILDLDLDLAIIYDHFSDKIE